MSNMKRVTLYLEVSQIEKLKKLSKLTGLRESQLHRDAIDVYEVVMVPVKKDKGEVKDV